MILQPVPCTPKHLGNAPKSGCWVFTDWCMLEHGGKESTCQCRRCRTPGFHPWIEKIPWRRKWQPTPILLPGESHGQKILAGYSPWGRTRLSKYACLCRPQPRSGLSVSPSKSKQHGQGDTPGDDGGRETCEGRK